jgi:hypothetical protein
MQRVVTSELRVVGPVQFDDRLPLPPTRLNFYRDIAVLAFPVPQGKRVSMSDGSPRSWTAAGNAVALVDGRSDTRVALAIPKQASRQQPRSNSTIHFKHARWNYWAKWD